MRLGGRLQAAIEVLENIQGRYRPIAAALKEWGSAHRFAGSADRAIIGNIVYDALRLKQSHAYLLDDDSASALVHGVMLRQWDMSPEQLAGQLEGDKFAPEPLSETSLDAFQSKTLSDAPIHIQADMPEWAIPSLQEAFGDQLLEEAAALNKRAPLDLRANTLRSDQEAVLKALLKHHAIAGQIAPHAVRVEVGDGLARLPNVSADVPFAKGFFEVQDEGSQLAAHLVGAKPGEQVLDYCAGGGGKTLALSADMNNKGQIFAFDSDSRRMAPMIERLKRAGTRNVQICESDIALEHLVGVCDHVLIDAPCSGAGTWRRRPDTKWRLSEKSLEQRISQQHEVLENANPYVKVGGELTYVTCSILPEENDKIIEAFLEENPEFELVDLKAAWTDLTDIDAPRSHKGFGLLCTPSRTQTDGFFVSKLKRIS